jgi:putative transposase
MSKTSIAQQLGVARSTLYYQSRLAVKDEQLRQDILQVLHLHPSYGYRRLAIHLGINKKRALRVMQLYGIKPYRRRGKKPNYAKAPSLADTELPNLIAGYFPVEPNDVWASDFTYIPYEGKFIYVATILDLYSRQVVGWHVSNRHDTALVAAAFYDALEHHGRPRILHSDRGSEYLSQIYMELASNCGIEMSYSAKAHPWENGYQESFYNGFKVDLGDPARFANIGQLTEAIHLQLYVYNHYRIHLSLKMAPKQYLVRQAQLAAVIL